MLLKIIDPIFDKLIQRVPQKKDDDTYTGAYLYYRVWQFIKPYWLRASIAIFITIPIGSIDAAIALSLRPYMDTMMITRSIGTANYVPLVIIGFTLLQGLLTYTLIYLNGWLGANITRDIRTALYKKLQSMDVRYFDQNPTGVIIQRFYADPDYIQTNLISTTREFLTRFFGSFSLIAVMVSTSWKLAIVAVVCLGGILFPLTRIKSILKKLAQQIALAFTDMMSFYSETYQGIRVIYSYNLTEKRLKSFYDYQGFMIKTSMKATQNQGWLTPSMHIVASVGMALVIWFGTKLVASGEITGGSFVSFFVALIMLYNPVKGLGNTIFTTHGTLLTANRIIDMLDTEPTVVNRPDAKTMTGINESLHFDNVSFQYIEDHPVIKSLNLKLQKGETIALVGNSGGGKTTITNLLCRFYDVDQGAVRIDGTDIRDFTMESLRQNISLVMQDNFLFNVSIKDNIALGDLDANEEQIWHALERAYLKDFVQKLPNGIDTLIGERGVMLSGGQRQRLAIARALLKDAPIVLLDEATSALDNESEAMVQKAIESLMENRTVIIIAHRLSTIRNVKRIIVLNQGEIAEEGSHNDLLANNGIYAKLYYTQFNPDDLINTLQHHANVQSELNQVKGVAEASQETPATV